MRTRALLGTAAIIGFVAVGCGQERAIATQAMNDGLVELKAGRSADAVKKLEEAAAADLTWADPSYYLGQIYHQKYEQLEDAERHYREALKRAEGNAQIHYRYGSVLADMGQHADAIAEFRKAVQANDQFAKAYFRMGLSQLEERKYLDGVASLTRSIELDPTMTIGEDGGSGPAYHALGDLYLRFNQFEKAEAVYADGVEKNPSNAQLQRGLGVAQLKQNKVDEAIASLKKAIEQDPRAATAYFNLAVALKAKGEKAAALAALDKFLQRADAGKDAVRISAAGGLRAELQKEAAPS